MKTEILINSKQIIDNLELLSDKKFAVELDINETNILKYIELFGFDVLKNYIMTVKYVDYPILEKVFGVENLWDMLNQIPKFMYNFSENIKGTCSNADFSDLKDSLSGYIHNNNYQIIEKYITKECKLFWYFGLFALDLLNIDFETYHQCAKQYMESRGYIYIDCIKPIYYKFGYVLRPHKQFHKGDSKYIKSIIDGVASAFYPVIHNQWEDYYVVPANCKLFKEVKNKIKEML